jgi:hypothetical protein
MNNDLEKGLVAETSAPLTLDSPRIAEFSFKTVSLSVLKPFIVMWIQSQVEELVTEEVLTQKIADQLVDKLIKAINKI